MAPTESVGPVAMFWQKAYRLSPATATKSALAARVKVETVHPAASLTAAKELTALLRLMVAAVAVDRPTSDPREVAWVIESSLPAAAVAVEVTVVTHRA